MTKEATITASAILKHLGMWQEHSIGTVVQHGLISTLIDKVIEERTAELQKALKLLSAPIDELKDCYPVVLYFNSDADREEFVQTVQEAKPGLRSFSI